MNNNQRKVIAVALVLIGAVLFYTMADVGHDPDLFDPQAALGFAAQGHSYPYTLLYSWENRPGGITSYLYIKNGTSGVVLGLLMPLGLWAAAAFVALGSRKIDGGMGHPAKTR